MDEKDLPLELPDSNDFRPSGTGEGPLANLKSWININTNERRDSNTMPTHAGAAWYFLRFMDPHNEKEFASREALDYWQQVDVYIGGSEHAVAHLLYARLWIKILHDLNYLSFDEPFKKLINQGKITGDSRFVYRFVTDYSASYPGPLGEKYNNVNPSIFISGNIGERFLNAKETEADRTYVQTEVKKINDLIKNKYPDAYFELRLKKGFEITKLHVDVNIVNGLELDIEAFKKWKPDFANAEFILEDGKYITGSAIEKMSKSYFNVVNPDDIIDNYGTDTLRMYEMFLGPLEMSKPWNTNGIDGVFKFLRKFWNLSHDQSGNFIISDAEPTRDELKILHKTIRKIEQDIENFSFNTSVSEFMICVNELGALKCNKRAILEPLVVALASYAPHIAEELWEKLGHKDTIFNAAFPEYNEAYLKENSFEYPISINGKVRAKMEFALDMPKEAIEKVVMSSELVQKWTEGKPPKKVIIVQGKIVNVVM
jgi:leucyl-tRNA synthetase